MHRAERISDCFGKGETNILGASSGFEFLYRDFSEINSKVRVLNFFSGEVNLHVVGSSF